MPKTKQSVKLRATPEIATEEDVTTNLDNVTEEQLQEMKEKLFTEKPELRAAFESLEAMNRDRSSQAQNAFEVFKNKRGKVTEELLMQFPNSPTSKETLVALNHYKLAFSILWSYNKQRVLLQSDCDFLKNGFHNFIEGYMLAQFMSQQFPPPAALEIWIEDYLKLRPNDSLVEYLHLNYVVAIKASEKSDYERCKDIIRAREKFVHKLLPYKSVETEKRILISSYFMLGALYTSTDQYERALEAFENCNTLDETNLEAIYGIAFHHRDGDSEKALAYCNKYLDVAPKCDRKYPNTHYLIGYIYARHFQNVKPQKTNKHFQNMKLAKKYYTLGQKAEKTQLPFNPPTESSPKAFLEAILPVAEKVTPDSKQHLDLLDLD